MLPDTQDLRVTPVGMRSHRVWRECPALEEIDRLLWVVGITDIDAMIAYFRAHNLIGRASDARIRRVE